MGIAPISPGDPVVGYIATDSDGDYVVDLLRDIPVGYLLVIVGAQGTGSASNSGAPQPHLWNPATNNVYIYNVVDTQSNEWGYAMDESLAFCGRLPMTLVTNALEAGTDTITVTIEADRENPTYGTGLVGRVLCFSGFAAFSPNNGLPVAMNYPIFSVPYNEFDGFFSLDPGDAIPLPRFVVDGGVAFNTTPNLQFESPFQYVSSEFEYGQDAGVTGQTLILAAISWDGTSPPWDYLYTTDEEDPGPTPTEGPAPDGLGLSADSGTWDFDAVNPDEGWVDLDADTLGIAFESRYAYLIRPTPPAISGGPNLTQIQGTYDAAGGSWGDNQAQIADGDAYPYEPGSYTGTPIFPLGDPNSISSPVYPKTWHMEGIATGLAQEVTGTYFFRSRTPAVGSVDA